MEVGEYEVGEVHFSVVEDVDGGGRFVGFNNESVAARMAGER